MTQNTTATAGPLTYRTLTEVAQYTEAQGIVDHLSDSGFPVEHVRIVGTGMRSVEQVTGRKTKGKAALQGAGAGAWFGLLLGLLFALFVPGIAWLMVVFVSVLFGAAWGALFGFLAHLATGGRRDFASVKALEAQNYEIQVAAAHTTDAARILGL